MKKSMVCKNCETRVPGCHDRCAKFIAESIQLAEQRRKKIAKMNAEWDQNMLSMRRKNMTRKKKGE